MAEPSAVQVELVVRLELRSSLPAEEVARRAEDGLRVQLRQRPLEVSEVGYARLLGTDYILRTP